MPSAALFQLFAWVSLIASGLTAVKLYQSGLYSRYPVFFAYLIYRVPQIATTLLLNDTRSTVYFYSWLIAQPLTIIFYVWMVLELYSLVLEKHKGLYTLGRWAMYLGMSVSLILSILSLLPRIAPATKPGYKGVAYMLAADRGVTFSLALFLLLMLFLLSRYPVPLSRNIVLHASLYTVFFLCNTLDVMLQSVFGVHLYVTIDTGLTAVSALCVLAWLLFLSPNGEEVRINIPHFGPEQEQRILLQLDSLNTTLLRVARK